MFRLSRCRIHKHKTKGAMFLFTVVRIINILFKKGIIRLKIIFNYVT